MAAVAVREKPQVQRRLEDIMSAIGDVPFHRIRATTYPGPVTEAELIRLNQTKEEGLFELVDGLLVEKDMSFYEARVGLILAAEMNSYASRHKLGVVFPADAMQRFGRQIRLPDISFVSLDRLPNGKMPRGNILNVGIDLAVEVLSESNTPAEMLRKRQEYFAAGAKQVWEIEPESETARIYTSPTRSREIGPDGTLDGGKIIPGFSLTMAKLFADVGLRG